MYELTMQEKTRQSIILYEYYTCTLFFFITEPQEVRISVNGHRMFHLLVFMDLHYKQYIWFLCTHLCKILAVDSRIYRCLCSHQFCCLLSLRSSYWTQNPKSHQVVSSVHSSSIYLLWNPDHWSISGHHCGVDNIIQSSSWVI